MKSQQDNIHATEVVAIETQYFLFRLHLEANRILTSLNEILYLLFIYTKSILDKLLIVAKQYGKMFGKVVHHRF